MQSTSKQAILRVHNAIQAWRSLFLESPKVILALSGGKDSMVLLHALVAMDIPVSVVHVNHGLQVLADQWSQHCLDVSAQWEVSCEVKKVFVQKVARRGLEDSARQARYEALWQSVPDGGILLTAHHQRDQAETFLMRLMRGSGIKGLSGMKAQQDTSNDRQLIRPLLSVSYADIEAYAAFYALNWVDDPSNSNEDFTRNYYRHRVLPILHPDTPLLAIEKITDTCLRLSESQQLLDMMAEEDWLRIAKNDRVFDLEQWQSMPWLRAKQVFSWRWQQLGGATLSSYQWKEIEDQFYSSMDKDRHPHFSWHGWSLVSGAGLLWLLTDDDLADIESFEAKSDQAWGSWGRVVIVEKSHEHELSGCYWRMREISDEVVVKGARKTLKKWLQSQKQIPSWQKKRWPVLCNSNHQVVGWANMPEAWWSSDIRLSAYLIPSLI